MINPLDLPIIFSNSCPQHQIVNNSLASPPQLLIQSQYKSFQLPLQQVLIYDRNESVDLMVTRPFALSFNGNFECANVDKVYLIEGGNQYSEETYDIYIKTHDTNAIDNIEDYFLFRIQNNRKNKKYRFNIKNINNNNNHFNRSKITPFSQGLKPVMLSLNEYEKNKIGWNNIIDTTYDSESNVLSFTIIFNYAKDTIYIGKYVPYSYSHLTNVLTSMSSNPQINHYFDILPLSNASSFGNVNMMHIHYGNKNNDKQIILIVGRMNANDHISSWLMDGLMKKLLDMNNFSNYIRDNYQFMIVPMINIDGCINGYNNINKSFQNEWCFPSIHVIDSVQKIKELCVHLHSRNQFAGYIEVLGSDNYKDTNGIFTYAVEHNPAGSTRIDSCHLVSNLIKELNLDYNENENYFANLYGNNNQKNLLNISSMMIAHEFCLQLSCAIQCAPFKPTVNYEDTGDKKVIQYNLNDMVRIGELISVSLIKFLGNTEDITNDTINQDEYVLEKLSTMNPFKRDDFIVKPDNTFYPINYIPDVSNNGYLHINLDEIEGNLVKFDDSPSASPLPKRSKPPTPLSPRLYMSPSPVVSRSSTPRSPINNNNNKMLQTKDLDLGSPSKAMTDSIFTRNISNIDSSILSVNIKPKVLHSYDNTSIDNNDTQTKASDATDVLSVNYGPGSELYQYKRRAMTSQARNRSVYHQYVLDPNYNDNIDGNNNNNKLMNNAKCPKNTYGQFRRKYLAIPEFMRPVLTPSLRAQEKKKEIFVYKNNIDILNNNNNSNIEISSTTSPISPSPPSIRPKSAYTKLSVSPFKENKPEIVVMNKDCDALENIKPIKPNKQFNLGIKVDFQNQQQRDMVISNEDRNEKQNNNNISLLKYNPIGNGDIEIGKLASSNASNQLLDFISNEEKVVKIHSMRPPETIQSSNNRNIQNIKHRNIVSSEQKRPKSALKLKIVNLF